MKSISFVKQIIVIFFFLASIRAQAQSWPKSNAQWIYCTAGNAFPELSYDTLVLKYTHDTIINNVTYNITQNPNNPTDQYLKHLTRYSNDTVYRWINNQEYLFFHFQLDLNEVFTTYRSYGGYDDTTCLQWLTLKVIDSSSTILNNESVTKWVLKDTVGVDLTPNQTGQLTYSEFVLYEKYGFESAFWLHNMFEQPQCQWLSDGGYATLSGYNDDNTIEWKNDCPVLNLEEFRKENNLVLFPNPAQDVLMFDDIKPQEISIYNLEGQLILSFNKPINNKINIENLASGYYFLSMKVDEKVVKTRFIKE